MSFAPEVDTIIIPLSGKINTGSSEGKVTEKSRQCPICHVYYKYGNSYWQHVRYVHASFLSQCVICEKSYKRTTMAKHHILHSHKIAWHLCSNYVRKIKKSDLSQNQEIKNEIENKNNNLKYFKKKTLHLISCFNCYDCPGSFATIDELFEHVKSHRGKEDSIDYDEEDDNNENEDYEDDQSNQNDHDDDIDLDHDGNAENDADDDDENVNEVDENDTGGSDDDADENDDNDNDNDDNDDDGDGGNGGATDDVDGDDDGDGGVDGDDEEDDIKQMDDYNGVECVENHNYAIDDMH